MQLLHSFTFKKSVTLFICTLALVLSGCNSTNNVKQVETLSNYSADSKVLLMPVDVELSVLTASGMTEVNAEWTENAKQHMHSAINDILAENRIQLAHYQPTTDDINADTVQLEKLHQYVGSNILIHHFGMLPLPSKNKTFDWTLGDEAAALKNETGADYALFVFVRDSYASGGRIAMQIGMAALGVGIAGGTQVGFASLVDLNNGDIVWFNQLVSTSGDLREVAPAGKTVKNLLEGIPAPE